MDTLAHIIVAMPTMDWTVDKDDDLDDEEVKPIRLSQSKGHPLITFCFQVLRIKLLRQSYKLKGTKLWIVKN